MTDWQSEFFYIINPCICNIAWLQSCHKCVIEPEILSTWSCKLNPLTRAKSTHYAHLAIFLYYPHSDGVSFLFFSAEESL